MQVSCTVCMGFQQWLGANASKNFHMTGFKIRGPSSGHLHHCLWKKYFSGSDCSILMYYIPLESSWEGLSSESGQSLDNLYGKLQNPVEVAHFLQFRGFFLNPVNTDRGLKTDQMGHILYCWKDIEKFYPVKLVNGQPGWKPRLGYSKDKADE